MVSLEPFQGLIEPLIIGASTAQFLEVGLNLGLERFIGLGLIGFEIGVQIPDLSAYPGLLFAVRFIERGQFKNVALGVNLTQGMLKDVKLPGIVAQNAHLGWKPVG